MGMLVIIKDVINQTLGDEFTFQQDNTLKHKAMFSLCLYGVLCVDG